VLVIIVYFTSGTICQAPLERATVSKECDWIAALNRNAATINVERDSCRRQGRERHHDQ
jgi:hypothetical protein